MEDKKNITTQEDIDNIRFKITEIETDIELGKNRKQELKSQQNKLKELLGE